MGIHTVCAEMFHEDTQDRHDEANGTFSEFWKTIKNLQQEMDLSGIGRRWCTSSSDVQELLLYCNLC